MRCGSTPLTTRCATRWARAFAFPDPAAHPCPTPSAGAPDCNTPHTKQERAAGAAAQSKTRWRAPQGDAEWMTEKQVLRLKPAPRLEQIGDKHSDRAQDRKHRPG